jgi:hypothetical protein
MIDLETSSLEIRKVTVTIKNDEDILVTHDPHLHKELFVTSLFLILHLTDVKLVLTVK